MRPYAHGKPSKSNVAPQQVSAAVAAQRICPARYCGFPIMRSRSAPAVKRNSGLAVGNTIAGLCIHKVYKTKNMNLVKFMISVLISIGIFNVEIFLFFSYIPHFFVVFFRIIVQLLRSDILRRLFGILGGTARRKTLSTGTALRAMLPQCNHQNSSKFSYSVFFFLFITCLISFEINVFCSYMLIYYLRIFVIICRLFLCYIRFNFKIFCSCHCILLWDRLWGPSLSFHKQEADTFGFKTLLVERYFFYFLAELPRIFHSIETLQMLNYYPSNNK